MVVVNISKKYLISWQAGVPAQRPRVVRWEWFLGSGGVAGLRRIAVRFRRGFARTAAVRAPRSHSILGRRSLCVLELLRVLLVPGHGIGPRCGDSIDLQPKVDRLAFVESRCEERRFGKAVLRPFQPDRLRPAQQFAETQPAFPR